MDVSADAVPIGANFGRGTVNRQVSAGASHRIGGNADKAASGVGRDPIFAEDNTNIRRCVGNEIVSDVRFSVSDDICIAGTWITGGSCINSVANTTGGVYAADYLGGHSRPNWPHRSRSEACVGRANYTGHC